MRAARTSTSEDRAKGFTLIELLIVVAIIGIIAAVAIPNLMNALDKARQKRTMSDMRTIGSSIEAYGVDQARYPVSITAWANLKALINPFYFRSPPDTDAWDHTWDVDTAADGGDYTIRSLGKDGLASAQGGGTTTDFDCDIIFYTGQFFQWPQGTQS